MTHLDGLASIAGRERDPGEFLHRCVLADQIEAEFPGVELAG